MSDDETTKAIEEKSFSETVRRETRLSGETRVRESE